MFHLGKHFIILIICGCVFLLLLIIGIIVFLNKPNPINTFVAVGEGSDTIAWSDDGKIWNKIAADSGFKQRGTCVASNGNVWVAGGQEAPDSNAKNMVFSKDNGRTWSPVNPPPEKGGNNNIVKGLVWNGTNFIAVGDGFIGGTTAVWSKDGQNWNSSTSNVVTTTNSFIVYGSVLACNGKICVCFGGTNEADLPCAIIYSDDDGESWVILNGQGFSTNSASFLAVNDNNYWVAISMYSKPTNILISSDGKDWKSPISDKNIFNDSTCELYCVAHDNGSNWVVVGNKGIGFSSDNGQTWVNATKNNDDIADSFSSVVYNGKIWVASSRYSILYSSDGINWTESDTNKSQHETHLCSNGTVWVSGGYQSPAIRWSDDITKPWNSTPDNFFKNVDGKNVGVVHAIACRYKV